MEVDDSRLIIELNQQVTRNQEHGKPLDHDIPAEKFQRFIEILRGNRASASSVATKGKAKPKVEPMKGEAILDLFK